MLGSTSDPFGTLLKHFRQRQHLTQQQLAKAIGAHRNTIGRWEEGSFLPENKALVLDLARHLRLDEHEARQLLDASLIAPMPAWSVPYLRNPFFTGREETLATLHSRLGPGQQIALTQSYALHGLGGIGKTQLALEYAYRYALEYSAIFWIGAESVEEVHASVLRIAERLNLPERTESDQQRIVAAVQRWLETRGEWLLIWDNLEDLDLLPHFLPAMRQGAILITTRRQALGTVAQGIDLEPMEEEEGTLFLLRRAKVLEPEATGEQLRHLAIRKPGEYAAALELVTTLGGLPLALDQAGAYIEETGCGLAGYLHRYEQQRVQLLDRRGISGRDHPQSVTTTFKLSHERVEREQGAAADLLRVCALLHAEAIPEELFEAGAIHLGPELAPLTADPSRFDQTIAVLRTLSLLQRQPETRTLSIHRLVQAVLREHMSEEEQAMWGRRLSTALNAVFPEVTHDSWHQCERLLPHVLAYAAAVPDQAEDQALAEVLRKAADYLRERAQYEQAEPLYQRALHIFEQVLGPEHLAVARLLHSLATFYRMQGKYEQAEIPGKRALHIREQALGPMHPDVATSLNMLANFYSDQGKYEQAEPLYQRSLDIRKRALGPEHPALASSFNNLAIFYTEQGKYEQAEPLFLRALSIRELALGPEHPDVAVSLNNLAFLASDQGKYEQAEPLLLRALHIWERALGPEHPNLASSFNNLAVLYTERKKYEQAEPLFLRALHIWEQTLGPEHPHVAELLNGLANLSQKQGRDEQAEALYQRALRIQEQYRSENHPETAQTLHDLSSFYQKQGNLREALSFAERALKIRTQFLGDTHSKTIATRMLYTQLIQAHENAEEARSFEQSEEEIQNDSE
jgi:tetratricopeptide (TPR) repeat protein